MSERHMPPPERPKSGRQEGEQEHLREDAGMEGGALDEAEREEQLRENAGRSVEEPEEDKGLIEKVKDKLTGQ